MFKQIIALMQANKIATFVCAGALVTTATVGGGVVATISTKDNKESNVSQVIETTEEDRDTYLAEKESKESKKESSEVESKEEVESSEEETMEESAKEEGAESTENEVTEQMVAENNVEVHTNNGNGNTSQQAVTGSETSKQQQTTPQSSATNQTVTTPQASTTTKPQQTKPAETTPQTQPATKPVGTQPAVTETQPAKQQETKPVETTPQQTQPVVETKPAETTPQTQPVVETPAPTQPVETTPAEPETYLVMTDGKNKTIVEMSKEEYYKWLDTDGNRYILQTFVENGREIYTTGKEYSTMQLIAEFGPDVGLGDYEVGVGGVTIIY